MAGVCDVGMSELVCGVAYLAAWQKTIRGTEVVEKRRTVRAKCHQITPKLSQNEDKYAAKKYTLSRIIVVRREEMEMELSTAHHVIKSIITLHASSSFRVPYTRRLLHKCPDIGI